MDNFWKISGKVVKHKNHDLILAFKIGYDIL